MQARRTKRFIAQRQEPSDTYGATPSHARPNPRWTGHDLALATAIAASRRRTIIEQRHNRSDRE